VSFSYGRRKPDVKRLLLVAASLLLAASSVLARTWYIQPDGSGDAPTIQAGIDSAWIGDIVELSAGIYRGTGNRDIEYFQKPITVRSATGDPWGCIIDCEGTEDNLHRGFCFGHDELPLSVLEGVCVTNGVNYWGGGIRCRNSSPTIQNCVLLGNTAIGSMGSEGGGLHCFGGLPVIRQCVFKDNTADGPSGGGGGAACVGYTNVLIEQCVFDGNIAVGGRGGGVAVAWQDCRPVIRDCAFYGNRADVEGGAIWCGSSTTVGFSLEGSTLVGNAAPTGAGIFYRVGSGGAEPPVVERSLLAFNTMGSAIYCLGASAVVEIRCTDIIGNDGGDWVGSIASQYGVNGNFTADPLFCGAGIGDFSLASTSPCLPGQHPDGYDCDLIGAFGEGCSGTTAVEQTTWGGIKRMFR
jgi:hypothetical protein